MFALDAVLFPDGNPAVVVVMETEVGLDVILLEKVRTGGRCIPELDFIDEVAVLVRLTEEGELVFGEFFLQDVFEDFFCAVVVSVLIGVLFEERFD